MQIIVSFVSVLYHTFIFLEEAYKSKFILELYLRTPHFYAMNEKFLSNKTSRPTCCVLVHHRHCFPFVELHDVEHCAADGGVIWVQVDVEAVLVVHRWVFPAGLDVRNLQSVADGLDRTH